MATTKKRITLNLTESDVRMLQTIHERTSDEFNNILKKALFYYYLERFQDKESKS